MALKLLRIDVNALGEYVGRLSALYYRLGLWKDWPQVLDGLQGNIQHPWWQRKITYYRSVYHLAPDGDRTEGRRELAKLGPITMDEEDLDILHLFVDLEFGNQSFADRVAILDRILVIGEERSNQLQYRGAKAVQYYLIGDRKAAEKLLLDVVELVRQTEEADPLEGYERHQFGALLQLLGCLNRDVDVLNESVSQFQALLAEDNWTERGRAALHRNVGDSYRYAGEWELAERAYTDAIAMANLDIDKVHLAQCLLHLRGADKALVEIEGINRDALDRREFDDFTFAYASIAIAVGRAEQLQQAKKLLENLPSSEPVFNEERLRLLVKTTDALMHGNQAAKADMAGAARGDAVSVSSFFLLQPNLFGLGINFNAIVDYLARRRPKDPPS